MNKEIRIVDEKRGVVQVTTSDERWYSEIVTDKETGLPTVAWKPSVTFITSSYPKGIGYAKWLADKGWDSAEQIKVEAGDRGTIVHHAIEKLMMEGRLKMDEPIKDREGVERQMTADEYYSVMTFGQWYESVGKPKAIHIERTVTSNEHGYAGTLDYLFDMLEGPTLLDVKTSKSVWPSHELQVSALKQACSEEGIVVARLGILQVGYMANKKQHYKYTDIEDKFDLFLATKKIWENDHGDEKPLQREFPMEIVLNNIA